MGTIEPLTGLLEITAKAAEDAEKPDDLEERQADSQ